MDLRWVWDNTKRAYTKMEGDGDAEKPSCVHCEAKDWDFMDFKRVHF